MQREKYRPATKFASFFYGQKFTAKCLLALSLFVSAPLFANEMCTQLCVPCLERANDSMCIQINATCNCQALIDSIQAAETARTEKVKALKETLKTNLSENCQKEFCSFKIKIKNDELKYFHKAKAPETIEKLAAAAQQAKGACGADGKWADGSWHHLHFFYAERQSDGSNLYIRTNLKNVALPIYSENVEAMPEFPKE